VIQFEELESFCHQCEMLLKANIIQILAKTVKLIGQLEKFLMGQNLTFEI
jgi:hypothetical protein